MKENDYVLFSHRSIVTGSSSYNPRRSTHHVVESVTEFSQEFVQRDEISMNVTLRSSCVIATVHDVAKQIYIYTHLIGL